MADFYIKRGDRLPNLQATLKNEDGSIADLTGANVRFNMFPVGSVVAKVNSGASIEGAPTNGNVYYSWQAGDTDICGEFYGEFEVEFNSGLKETFPNKGYIKILISADLN